MIEPVCRHPERAVVVVEIDAIAVSLARERAHPTLMLHPLIVAADITASQLDLSGATAIDTGFYRPGHGVNIDQTVTKDASEVDRQSHAQGAIDPVCGHPERAIVIIDIDAIPVPLAGERADATLMLHALIVATHVASM